MVRDGEADCDFIRAAMASFRASQLRLNKISAWIGSKYRFYPIKVIRSIDTEWNGVNDSYIDAHSILQRPQLL